MVSLAVVDPRPAKEGIGSRCAVITVSWLGKLPPSLSAKCSPAK